MTASPARPSAPMVLGAACWTLTVAYLLVQPVVAAAWPTPYDLTTNSISDLGLTGCGNFRRPDGSVVYACSPRHALMNAVFVMVGVLTAAGAMLTRAIWPRRRGTSLGVAFVVLAGVGGILVGLAPANVNLAVHGAGALLQVPGAVAPLLLGMAAWSVQWPVAAFSVLCGVIGSAASLLYFSGSHLGLGHGGMEHLAFDPLTIWTTVLGVVLLGRWLAARRAIR
jgi:hypothetical membrane protein